MPITIYFPTIIGTEVDQIEKLVVMTMFFIRKHLDMGIHDTVCVVSQELVNIVLSIVHKEVQQTRELEVKQTNSSENNVTSTM